MPARAPQPLQPYDIAHPIYVNWHKEYFPIGGPRGMLLGGEFNVLPQGPAFSRFAGFVADRNSIQMRSRRKMGPTGSPKRR